MFNYCYIGEDKNKWTRYVTFVCIEEHCNRKLTISFVAYIYGGRERKGGCGVEAKHHKKDRCSQH